MKAWVAWPLLALPICAAAAPQWPLVQSIFFEGNHTTQEQVMRREMVIGVGDPADPERIERSRQYIQDLGLFRGVQVRERVVPGGIALTFTVDEKWYFLLYPRLSATVEGQTSAGAALRWSNIGGLNHSLRVNAERSDRKLQDRGRETRYSLGYSAPFVLDSPYRINFAAGYTLSPVSDTVSYDETFYNTSLLVSRTFSDPEGARSQGTTVGLGLAWQREDRAGAGVPPPYGQATALVASYGYRDLRFRTYSEEGVSWRVGTAFARRQLASDYSYQAADASYSRFLQVGDKAHQSLIYSFSAGIFANGPREVNVYTFGGSSVLRAYDANQFEGNAYYLGTVEFFRPVYRSSVRVGAILEAGNLFERSHDAVLDEVKTSLGLALRVRFTRFVNFEVELGYAIPLDGGSGKLFGGGV